jgi:site-specific recombinase XerD
MSKEFGYITEITEKWISEAYPTASTQSVWKYKDRMNRFLEFLGMTDAEYVESYKTAKDRHDWAKDMGKKLIDFMNKRKSEGYATNTIRGELSTPRAFSRDNCTTLLIQRRKIPKARTAKGEHEFNREELAKMFYVGDVRGKAVLATAVSLGFSVKDFAELKRDYIESLVNKALEEKIDFIGFSYERGKTGVESRSHLTPEAVNSLKAWFEYIDASRAEKGLPKSEWVWCNGNGGHLDPQTLNDIIKDLVSKANIATTGKVKFHLLRKYVMGALHTAGFDSWETKRALGKEIPTSDATYLQKLNGDVDRKFPVAYEEMKLSGYANHNHTRLEELEVKVQQLEQRDEQREMELNAMRRILEFAVSPEALKKAILETAKLLPKMTPEKLKGIENSLKMVKSEAELDQQLSNIMKVIKSEKDKR